MEAIGANSGGGGSRKAQFAQAPFDGDLPYRCGADEYVVGWIADGISGNFTQGLGLAVPPEEDMGIQ